MDILLSYIFLLRHLSRHNHENGTKRVVLGHFATTAFRDHLGMHLCDKRLWHCRRKRNRYIDIA